MTKQDNSCSYRFIPSSLTELPANREYDIIIRQQPERAKMSVINERDRRPIEPPPILQLKWINCSQDETKKSLQSPFYFVVANLLDVENNDKLLLPNQEYLNGTIVSSLYRLRDIDNKDGGFFVFGDLSVKRNGIFKLQFNLFEIVEGDVQTRCTIISDPFTVYLPKHFPGPLEATFLSRTFSDQGVKMRIRKEHRLQSNTTRKRKSSAEQKSSSSSSLSSSNENNNSKSKKITTESYMRHKSLSISSSSSNEVYFGKFSSNATTTTASSSSSSSSSSNNNNNNNNNNNTSIPSMSSSSSLSSATSSPMMIDHPHPHHESTTSSSSMYKFHHHHQHHPHPHHDLPIYPTPQSSFDLVSDIKQLQLQRSTSPSSSTTISSSTNNNKPYSSPPSPTYTSSPPPLPAYTSSPTPLPVTGNLNNYHLTSSSTTTTMIASNILSSSPSSSYNLLPHSPPLSISSSSSSNHHHLFKLPPLKMIFGDNNNNNMDDHSLFSKNKPANRQLPPITTHYSS